MRLSTRPYGLRGTLTRFSAEPLQPCPDRRLTRLYDSHLRPARGCRGLNHSTAKRNDDADDADNHSDRGSGPSSSSQRDHRLSSRVLQSLKRVFGRETLASTVIAGCQEADDARTGQHLESEAAKSRLYTPISTESTARLEKSFARTRAHQLHIAGRENTAGGGKPNIGREQLKEPKDRTVRGTNRVRPLFTNDLIYALSRRGAHHAVPAFAQDSRRIALEYKRENYTSLRRILAKFVAYGGNGAGPGALQTGFPDHDDRGVSSSDLIYLQDQGYNMSDLERWAHFLLIRDPVEAAQSILQHQINASSNPQGRSRIPLFVLGTFLRRDHLPAAALRYILSCMWHVLDTTEAEPNPAAVVGSTDENVFCVFNRLLACARQVWPASIPNIARIITAHVDRLKSVGTQLTDSPNQENYLVLTSLFNATLRLLALPTAIQPMQSSAVQERAQFHVLARMARYSRPLPITREGYRAVITVQLRRSKRVQDREWAMLKSKSWPPVKVARNRLDEAKDLEYGRSNAFRAVERLQEAGYPTTVWEHVASILSGWDTDGSPTIQTRANLSDDFRDGPNKQREWAARIQATRTLPEAWACFLSCQENGCNLGEQEYRALFEKLILDAKSRSRAAFQRPENRASITQALPGDGKEVTSPPAFAIEAIYTNSVPPTFEELFDQMQEAGVTPSNALFRLLLSEAPRFDLGVRTLDFWSEVDEGMRDFLLQPAESATQARLDQVSPSTLTVLIKFLCRFPIRQPTGLKMQNIMKPFIIPGWRLKSSCIACAFHLLSEHESRHRPPWNVLLHTLSALPFQSRIIVLRQDTPVDVELLLRLKLMRTIVTTMSAQGLEPDEVSFFHLCNASVRATMAARRIRASDESASPEAEVDAFSKPTLIEELQHKPDGRMNATLEAKLLLETGSRFLRVLFQALVQTRDPLISSTENIAVESRDSISSIPRIIRIPSPAHLQAFVRALGVLGDHEGLLSLVKWLREHYKEYDQFTEDSLGHGYRRRSMLVAIRVFLECPEKARFMGTLGSEGLEGASEEIIELAKQEIDAIDGWLGWPTDDEVAAYCNQPAPAPGVK